MLFTVLSLPNSVGTKSKQKGRARKRVKLTRRVCRAFEVGLSELLELLTKESVENHLGKVKRYSTAVPDILSLLINTVPYASIASVLIAWIRTKQNRKVHIQYADNTSITLEGHHTKEEVEYYFNKKEKAGIFVESEPAKDGLG
ncbi:hypothetical protein O8413_17690 [Vibrio furnissii]|uniref:hypothetical protein n=1 Tax=Vibrio furnissii TaxID=29494 RepID=UPI0024BA7B70|nr:hypothetical protein [Vibrio furnissii]WHR53986.1 hypothetical protein O8413_17690 [Vibrio furnissii]